MCKEIIYWIAEFIYYWSLIFFGIKLFLRKYDVSLKENEKIENMVILLVSTPIVYICVLNYSLVSFSNATSYLLYLYMYFFIFIYTKKRLKNIFSMIIIYVNVMRLIDLLINTVIVEVNSISRDIYLDLINYGLARAFFLLSLSICHYYLCKSIYNSLIYEYLRENKFFRYFIALYTYLGTSCFSVVYYSDYKNSLLRYWTFYIICAFVSIGLVLFYFIYIKNREKERLLSMRNDMMESNYHDMQKMYDLNRTLQHDYKNHLLAVSELIKVNKNEEALQYIQGYIGYDSKYFIEVNSGNDVIDIIINSKYNEACEKQIIFTYDIEYLGVIRIQDIDLCALLSNMLDNAIEECEKIDNIKWLKICIYRRNDILLIRLENSLHPYSLKKKKFFETEKENIQLHGWGMKSIERVVKKYNGTKEYIIKNNEIDIFISLCIL